jgi:uncharacterized membrane protein HdeD (DUF308 family)
MSDSWTGRLGGPEAPSSTRRRLASTWTLVSHAPPDQLHKVRRILLVTGILALLGGAAAILVPIVASVTMTLFVGWMLILYGIVGGLQAFTAEVPGRTKAWRALNALLAVLVGLYLVVLPLSGTITLTFLLAVWFFGTGLFSLTAAWQWRGRSEAAWLAISGLLSLLLGILIAVSLPSSAAWAIGLLVGIQMIWWGTDALVAASALRRVLDGAAAH